MFDQPPSSSNSEARRSWRPQISLATMLCLTTIVLLLFAHYTMVFDFKQRLHKQEEKYQKLEKENALIKKEFSFLEVKDKDLICATRLPAFELYSYRFRIYYPPDKKYVLKYQLQSIPASGFGKPLDVRPIPQGSTIPSADEIVVNFGPKSMLLSVVSQNGSSSWTRSHSNKRDVKVMVGGINVNPGQIEVQEPGKPFVLVRRREFWQDKPSDPNRLEPSDSGLLLWIEEVPPTTPTTPMKTLPNSTTEAKQ